MLHPQIGSEGTEFSSDFFHSLMKYIFDSLWKSKDKEMVCNTPHIHVVRIFLEGCAAWPGQDPQHQPGKWTAAAVSIAFPTSVCCLKPK